MRRDRRHQPGQILRNHLLPGLLTRVRPDRHAVTERPADRPNPHAVIDCAVYLDGRRQPGHPHYADAYHRVRRQRSGFVWLGLHEPDAATMASVAATFELHGLTINQALTDGHRPTIEQHGDVTLLVCRTASYVEHAELTAFSEVVDTGDVMVFLGDRFAITVRHGAAGALRAVREELQRQPDLLAQGPWAVAYAVCDRMVDSYLDVAAHVEKDLERVEEAVFDHDRRTADVHQVYQLKRELVELKRAVMPLQAPLRWLVDQRRDALPATLRRYFTDLTGRLDRAVDRVAAFDDLLNSILQARLAQLSVDQNNDMRKIASWAAIAAVQTAIAGIYGMNFANMPELNWRYGYFGALALMAAAALALYRLFRRSGWL